LPITYTIDQARRLVVTRLWNDVSEDEVHFHNDSLRNDPLFDPGYRQLTDMSDLREIKVGTGMIRETAEDNFFRPGVRRAIVARTDGVFGMARMFAIHSESAGQTVEVFRDLPSAEGWLGL
jgi:hypothetical protein